MVSDTRRVIQSKGVGYRWEKDFFKCIQEAILEGYRIADSDQREDMSMRNYRGKYGRAVLYLEGHEPTVGKTEQGVVVENIAEEVVADSPDVETSSTETIEAQATEAEESSEVVVDVKKLVEEAQDKEALKAIAEEHNLEIDRNKKHPEAFRKALIAQLEG